MIEVTDMTLLEAHGQRDVVTKIMNKETSVDWMIRSNALVYTDLAASNYILHFWKNGTVVIHETNNPCRLDASDEDLRSLSSWVLQNGWSELCIADRLLENKSTLEYWHRAFIAGLITSPYFVKKEQEEMARFTKFQKIEKDEENDGTQAYVGI